MNRRVPLNVLPSGAEVLAVRIAEWPVRRREVLVLRDDSGKLRAFFNECRHVPIPLDSGGRKFTNSEGLLECKTHGALYRRDDGECVSGPCMGSRLVPVVIEDDSLIIDDSLL